MDREMLKQLVKDYIAVNNPNGVAKLAIKTNLSTSLINKIHAGAYYPKKQATLAVLLEALEFDQEAS